MRTTASILSAAAIVGLVAASPAPQQLDFDAIVAAPTVPTQPVLNGVGEQTVTIIAAALASDIQAQITTVATASVTGASASAASTLAPALRQKRTVQLQSVWCQWFGWGCVSSSNNSPASSTSCTTSKTSSSSGPVKTSTTSSSSSSSSSIVLTSSTGTSTTSFSSGTVTSSSTTACPTTPENGTYCGFINPEDPCAPQPDGYGPKVTPDTVSAFYAYPPFHSMASSAALVVASAETGVAYVQTFKDLNASSSANSYLGLYTLESYNVTECAAHCDSTSLCTAFNIYIERDPSQNPTANDSTAATVWGYWCPNPSSITNFKCTLWGSNLDASTATNTGDWREQFQVVVTASNGYDSTNYTTPINVTAPVTSSVSSAVAAATSSSSVSGSSATAKTSSVVTKASASASATPSVSVSPWSAPRNCSGKAINAGNYWMGSKFFPGPFNPQVCADYAIFQNAQNKQAAISAGKSSYTPCQMFNSYYLHKNGVPHGTYCALYDTQLSTSWATYSGGYASSGDHYECRQSWTYSLTTPDSGRC
ncbi:hypothetical protein MBLNU459_g4152t1 [Dothideomycetes sp. NU459]